MTLFFRINLLGATVGRDNIPLTASENVSGIDEIKFLIVRSSTFSNLEKSEVCPNIDYYRWKDICESAKSFTLCLSSRNALPTRINCNAIELDHV